MGMQTVLRKFFVQVDLEEHKKCDADGLAAMQELLQLKLTLDCLFRSQLFELRDELVRRDG
jgi:hypothetical protein